jgi:hypothetical protein
MQTTNDHRIMSTNARIQIAHDNGEEVSSVGSTDYSTIAQVMSKHDDGEEVTSKPPPKPKNVFKKIWNAIFK